MVVADAALLGAVVRCCCVLAVAGGGLRVDQRPLAQPEQLPHGPQLVRRHARLVLQPRPGLGPGHRGLGQAEAGEQTAVVDPWVVSLVPDQWGLSRNLNDNIRCT